MESNSKIKYIFAIVGALFIFGSIYSAFSTYKFLNSADIGFGEVIDLVESRSDDSTTYAPVVSFQTYNGHVYQFQSRVSSNPPAYSIGERVDVLYLESDPQDARINSFSSLWAVSLIFGVLGFIFFSVGTGILFFGLLKKQSNAKLIATGEKIITEYKGIEINERLSVNGRNPYNIITEWLDPESSKFTYLKAKTYGLTPQVILMSIILRFTLTS